MQSNTICSSMLTVGVFGSPIGVRLNRIKAAEVVAVGYRKDSMSCCAHGFNILAEMHQARDEPLEV